MRIETYLAALMFVAVQSLPAQPDTAAWLRHLVQADTLLGAQQYKRAVAPARAAMAYASAWHEQYPEYAARSANLLGGCLLSLDQMDEALALLRQAHQWLVQHGLTRSETFLANLNWRGAFCFYNNQFEEQIGISEELLQRCREHPVWRQSYELQAMNMAATAYIQLRRFDQAMPILEESYQIAQGEREYDTYNLPAIISNLAYVYKQTRAYDKALKLYRDALAMQVVRFGKENDNYARILNNMAKLYIALDSLDMALPLLQEALQILETTLGATHEEYFVQLDNLAFLYSKMNRRQDELACFRTIFEDIQTRVLRRSGAFSEKEQQSILRTTRYFVERVQHQVLTRAPDTCIHRLGYEGNLLLRGLKLRNSQRLLAALAALESPDIAALLAQWHQLRRAAYHAWLLPASAQAQALDTILSQANDLESALAYKSEPAKYVLPPVSWQQVQFALGPRQATVEFAMENRSKTASNEDWHYIAYVLRPQWPAPRAVALGSVRQADSLWQLASGSTLRQVDALYDTPNQNPHPLWQLLWQPLDSLLAGVSEVFYAPEGILHKLNPDAWRIHAQQRLCDRYRLRRLGSTRQLAQAAPANDGPKTALVAGGVQYGALDMPPASPSNARNAAGAEAERGGLWSFLPHSLQEAEQVRQQLQQNRYQVRLLSGEAATEEAFKQYAAQNPSPRVIHIASHGYFGAPAGKRSPSPFEQAAEPLLRSGIILANANEAWAGKLDTLTDNDGVLTAYEISQCHFNNTELVVLSACNTGLGEIQNMEGVYGLQRAFKMAGVRYLITSLWPVADGPARELMQSFYQQWMQGASIPDAFYQAVSRQRKRYPHPYYWAGFVLME